MRKTVRFAATAGIAALMAAGLAACGQGGSNGASGGSAGASGPPTVALSNAYIGNSWRQSMIDDFQNAAKQAQAAGTIKSFTVANAPGNNSATDQISQIKTVLLSKPDILLIDPASPTALVPVINQACNMGVKVVVFDSGIGSDAKCAYVVTDSFTQWAKTATEAVAKGMGGKGNLLISRGVVGSAPEAEYYAEQKDVLKGYPGIKVVGTDTGYCSSAEAQKAVLGMIASLPKVDGVAGCGDGFGIAQAFASAGRPIPAVTFEPSGQALRYWKGNQVGAGSVAIMSDPGESVAALYTALDIYHGKDVSKTTTFPSVEITQQTRDQWLKVVGQDQIASWQWTQQLVDQQIALSKQGDQLVAPPIPTN
ncbi:substrate-binding domain-containing protein [Sinomonas terrae]|uniref:Substrate-binding domain-containing protein n=1 Tax=Sinomonas terrae TaxID=2908838 RepID=A0ABS9U095_9MICC|nr:substrate-binding domain-containing protein [Sinomonas terrae]MCH6470060.1 substrate-binding domain-containing protein [Sinomonas terrae]